LHRVQKTSVPPFKILRTPAFCLLIRDWSKYSKKGTPPGSLILAIFELY
jgi:hypothetical protein